MPRGAKGCIREDLTGVDGLRSITTLRAPAIPKLRAGGAVTPSFSSIGDAGTIFLRRAGSILK